MQYPDIAPCTYPKVLHHQTERVCLHQSQYIWALPYCIVLVELITIYMQTNQGLWTPLSLPSSWKNRHVI